MNGPVVVHLICGPTGAGKTTYARRVAEAAGAVRFSIDEWMSALFWMDAHDPFPPALIWRTAAEVCRRGVPCVLEIGLTTAAARARYAGLALQAGFEVKLHLVDAPVDERWERVETRNRSPEADQLPFEVTREMFDFVETMWERPTAAELEANNGVAVDTGRAHV